MSKKKKSNKKVSKKEEKVITQPAEEKVEAVPEKKEKKMKKTNFLSLKNIILGVIAFLLISQYLQIQSLFGTFSFLEGRDSSLITEIGQIKEAYIQFGEDTNEIRTYLGFPTKDYFGVEEDASSGDGGKNEDELQLALFQYMSFLSDQETIDYNIETYTSYLNDLAVDEDYLALLEEKGVSTSGVLEGETSVSMYIYSPEGYKAISYYLSKEDGNLYVATYLEKDSVEAETVEDFIADATDLINDDLSDILESAVAIEDKTAEIREVVASADVVTELGTLSITISDEPISGNGEMIYSVYNSSEELIGEIHLDTEDIEVSLVDVNDDSVTLTVDDLSTSLIPFLQKLDTRTFFELKTEEAMAKLKNTFEDNGFQLLLSQAGLTISDEVREDDERIYYDIYDSSETHLSSLVIEKSTGVINIVGTDGTNPENLLFFDPDYKKKTLELPDEIPDYGNTITHEDGTFNILIAGKNGNLVDTMIFTHIDEVEKSIKMVSIPRDLFYNGRKINSLPYFYGMPELQKVLSEMTGYELDKYILIDMYAFIDVIDLIGGIDVTLEKAVIDPTYRVVDNGVASTLHYDAGDYHLGGVEALRLARSRHTSSDFARAERQQLILQALQDKARNFGFGDADTIYAIASSVLDQTETDVGLDEAIAYYFRYQGYEIQANNVMSSGNVLYVPPYTTVENCATMIAAAEENGEDKPGCENDNHAYTLLPKNNDWNVVKWFFEENFEGEAA
jgi:polyisoprenyl-teichoic acid--peptidoglycan teichoic acid transferase